MAYAFKINAESYAAFVEAFRAAGAGTGAFTPNFRAVGAAMGTTEHTAKRAWISGFPMMSKNYGPIEDKFPKPEPIIPEVVPVDVSSRMVTYGHDHTSHVSSRDVASAAGPPSVDSSPAHSVGTQLPIPTYSHPPEPTPPAAASPTAAIASPTDMATALDRLVGKQPAVLVREWEALEVSRNNAIGINILMGKVIERLMTEVPRLFKLDGVELTIANFTSITQDVAKVTTLLTAAQAKLMESQRLLMNMPTAITEHRVKPSGEPADESPELAARRARLAPLIALLSQAGASTYKGEEGGADVLDPSGAPVGNSGRFVGSAGPGGGVRAGDKPQPIDPLLTIK